MYACLQRFHRASSRLAAAGTTGPRRLFGSSKQKRTKDANSYYVTQPIFYVNSVPHIGHFYTIVLADTIKRYADLLGKNTKLSAGTDEHGLKIQQAAEKAGEDTLAFCTRYSDRFRELEAASNASVTDFIRTSDPKHHRAVAHFWERLVERGFIYKGKHEGWYAVSDEAFYTETQTEERADPTDPNKPSGRFAIESGQPVEWVSEENYKFRLSAFKDKLVEWLETNPDAVYPEIRRNEVLGWLRSGFDDLSVSRPRSRLKWGIPVPGDPDHTIYVWVDALVNYATVCGYPWPEDAGAGASDSSTSNNSRIPEFFPPDVQVVGKDIVRFHAVYWPALLMAAGLPLPKRILAHAHWTMSSQKMSKSKGNVVDPFEAIATYGLDPIRYFIIRNGGISDDGDYSPEEVLVRYKKDLVGQLANLASRCVSKSLCPDIEGFRRIAEQQRSQLDIRDAPLYNLLDGLSERTKAKFDQGEFGRGMWIVFDALATANKYISNNQPWVLVKQTDDPESRSRLQTVLFYALETVRLAAIMLQPVMPQKMELLLDHISVSRTERSWKHARFGAGWQTVEPSRASGSISTLFPKLK
ncbi:methionyl-tRNA synthetase [Coemansia sp. RSA 1939]|nr:methionyl-tRNA synthetase [Coemansia sp. RSA 1939]KAJ2594061.1 methionyl-tRNA synthetase [Coemansia sp. RSA 1804]